MTAAGLTKWQRRSWGSKELGRVRSEARGDAVRTLIDRHRAEFGTLYRAELTRRGLTPAARRSATSTRPTPPGNIDGL